MDIPGVKIVDQNDTPLLLLSRTATIDITELHRFLTERGFVLREGPNPPDVMDVDLGQCEARWLRVFRAVI